MNPDAIKDGGAAYPVAMSEQTHSNQNCAPFQQGMSLRDHFAGLAMAAVISGRSAHYGGAKIEIDEIASQAYLMADAMIRTREIG